jgi:hypothetical protein
VQLTEYSRVVFMVLTAGILLLPLLDCEIGHMTLPAFLNEDNKGIYFTGLFEDKTHSSTQKEL